MRITNLIAALFFVSFASNCSEPQWTLKDASAPPVNVPPARAAQDAVASGLDARDAPRTSSPSDAGGDGPAAAERPGADALARDGARDSSPEAGRADGALPICGDGKPDPNEQCDLGPSNSDTAHGKGLCRKDCKWAPYCGDGARNHGTEDCDNGAQRNNDNAYGEGACREDCKRGPYCGDGLKNYAQEDCDYGSQNVAEAYGEGKCDVTCKFAAYCGDGKTNGKGEECDDGKAANSGAPGKCSMTCKRVPPAPDAGA